MKKFTQPLKNTVNEKEVKKNKFQTFLSNFNTLKHSGKGFYQADDLRVDYTALKAQCKTKGIKNIPTEDELQLLI